MPFKCCVLNCSSKSDHIQGNDITFFRFPTEVTSSDYLKQLSLERRQAWVDAINRTDFTVEKLKYKHVCSKHFISGECSDLKDYLNPSWVPSLDMGLDENGIPDQMGNVNVIARKRRRKQLDNSGIIKDGEATSDVEEIIDDPLAICTPIYDDPTTSKRARKTAQTKVKIDQRPVTRRKTKSIRIPPADEQIEEIIDLDDESEETSPKTSESNKILNLNAEQKIEKATQPYESGNSKAETIAKLQAENITLLAELSRVRQHGKISIEILKNDNDVTVEYLTGFPSYEILEDVFQLVKNNLPQTMTTTAELSQFDAFMITLIKLKLDVPLSYLSIQYKVDLESISDLFLDTIIVLYKRLRRFVYWPKKQSSIENVPVAFKRIFGRRRIFIIDCLEVFTERPENYISRPNDPRFQTVKYLVCISPTGNISYISNGFGIWCTDKFVIDHCGFLEMINDDDIVLAERRLLYSSKPDEQDYHVIVPAYKNFKSQLIPITIKDNLKLATALSDIRRIIGELRYKFSILTNRQSIARTRATEHFSECIIKIICAIINLSQV